jgi:hypothetical protein
MRRAAIIALPLLVGAAHAAESQFLFDALRQPKYHMAWDKLMKDVQPTPDWLVQFNKNYDGVSDQLTPIAIDGKAYEISYVCKPTDCAGRRFEILFEAGGARAVGALGGKSDAPAYFGNPTPGEQDVLAKAMKGKDAS